MKKIGERILESALAATWYGILGAICLTGLVWFFWSLEGGFDRPFRDLPQFDRFYLAGTPIVGFLTLWIEVFVLSWRKKTKPNFPAPAQN